MKQILVDMQVLAAGLERLKTLPGVGVTVVEPSPTPRALPPEAARGANVLFCGAPPTNLADMPALELVQITSVGYEGWMGLGLSARGVRVANARGVFDTTIAEWNIAMLINLARDVPGMLRNQQQAVWERAARFQGEIRGKVVGFWGYGGIGRETARLAKSLGMTVHVLTRQGISPRKNTYLVAGTGDPEGRLPDRVFTTGEELAFLKGLDFLVLAMPQTPKTKGLVGEAHLRALPRTAFVLNPARGPLIQEQALLKALGEGWIAGAALDTHYYYPLPPEHPLWRMANVILTPHISGSEHAPLFLDRMWDLFVQNVERYLAGRAHLNELTPAELDET